MDNNNDNKSAILSDSNAKKSREVEDMASSQTSEWTTKDPQSSSYNEANKDVKLDESNNSIGSVSPNNGNSPIFQVCLIELTLLTLL